MSAKLPRPIFDIHHPPHRRALRTAIAILLAIALVYVIRPPHGEWIVLSAFIVSQDTVGSSLWKAEGRFLGAAAGAIASLAIYALIRQHHLLIFFTAFLTIFPYLYLLHALNNYGYAYFFLQVAYVCFVAAVGKHLSAGLIEWRAASIAIGCALGIAVALFVLPTSARPRLQRGQLKAWHELHLWFEAIVAAVRSPAIDSQRLAQLGSSAQRSVFKLDEHLASRKHELIGKPNSGCDWELLRQKDTEFIHSYRPIYRSLLDFSYLVCELAPADRPADRPAALDRKTEELIGDLTKIFERVADAIGQHSPFQVPPRDRFDARADACDPDETSLTEGELTILWQLNSVYEAIASYSEIRNQFLSLLADNSHPTKSTKLFLN